MRVAVIQLNSSGMLGNNLIATQLLVQRAVKEGARLVVLPQHFSSIPKDNRDWLLTQEEPGKGRVQQFMAQIAKDYGVWIVGCIPLKTSDPMKITNSCLVYDRSGNQVARYDKRHLFDAYLGDLEQHEESEYTQAGHEICVIQTPFGKLGLAVGFDLRFVDHFKALRAAGAEIIALPAAFPFCVGEVHWQALVSARAIDQQAYVLAANQTGRHDNHWQTYGHSMIVGPWGRVKNQCGDCVGLAIADLDLNRLRFLREEFPHFNRQD